MSVKTANGKWSEKLVDKEIKFYGLYEPTGAGDEPLAVDTDYDNLVFQRGEEYEGDDLKICEIDFTEYYNCLHYLCYDVADELNMLFQGDYNKHPYALVAYGNNWTGATGVKECENLNEVFFRLYDASFSDIKVSRNGKYIFYRESSHDCPMGALCVAIRLSVSEHERIKKLGSQSYDYMVKMANKARERFCQ